MKIICAACGHDRRHPCTADLMIERSDGSGLPFHMQCWYDGKSGPIVDLRGERLTYDDPKNPYQLRVAR